MPKRVLDFDALWASDKIAALPGWAQAEYAWLYGLADASGSFELTNLRVIWGRVAAIRKDLTLERLEETFQEFTERGLLFTWEAGGKRYGHWTGSDVPGRLPAPSWRGRLERLAPPAPRNLLAEYMSRFSSRREMTLAGVNAASSAAEPQGRPCDEEQSSRTSLSASPDSAQLKLGLEEAQAQEWDEDWKKVKERDTDTDMDKGELNPSRASVRESPQSGCQTDEPRNLQAEQGRIRAEELLDIYERERGDLPPATGLTSERRRQCAQRIRAGLSREEFSAAVRRAAATPFLAGHGARRWRASFDWLIANETNIRKVLEGTYDAQPARSMGSAGYGARTMDRALYPEIHTGRGPVAADYGVRVRPEALERIRAREAARGSP